MLLMFSLNLGFLAAQEESPGDEEEDKEPAIESDWSAFEKPSYAKGDQMFSIGLGPIFPALFRGNSGKMPNKAKIGGTGFIAYDYFFTSHFALGAEVNGSFNATIGENMVYIIPIGVRLTYQLAFHPIEIPLTMMVGFAPQKYLDQNYLGLVVKPSLGVYWRFNSDWSFGVNGAWWWLPEWTKNASENVNANFATLTIAARYHF